MMGTTENGTNHIGLLADALNAKAHHAEWQAVWLEQDPPTPQQCEQFWVDLKANITAGFAMPANWVSPPGNAPRAVRGSGPNPGYYGTIYHYVCYGGFAEDGPGESPSGRYVYVYDSGFSPWQYWVTFEQACTLMPPKGYVKAAAAPAGVPTLPGPVAEHSEAELLSYAMDDGLTLEEYERILPHVKASLLACECTNELRVAMWLAQIGHESCGLKFAEEVGDDAYFSQYNDRADLGNRPGTNDGIVYHGRSYIQTTGRTNYEEVSRWCAEQGYVPSPTFFVDNPEKLATPEYAFQGVNYYWIYARPKINAMADAGDIEGVTKAINGGLNGFDDRKARYERAKQVAAKLIPTAQPSPAEQMQPDPPPAKPETSLTGRPHHHSLNPVGDDLLYDIRAEGLCTQALVFAIARKLDLDAHKIYTDARNSF